MMTDRQYKRIYRLFDGVTPLNADCGKICGKNCCKGDSRTGMLLFPNEETALNVIEENGVRLAVCGGVCDRNERPLSCRIFPFFPVFENGRVKAVTDLRGINVCPMVSHRNEIRFSRRFLRHIRIVGKILYRDPECAEFMNRISEEIEEIKRINEMFGK